MAPSGGRWRDWPRRSDARAHERLVGGRPRGRMHAMQAEDLLKLVTTPMPFGKHKGVLIADLPGNYLNWFAREGFPKGEVGRLLQLMQEIDHNGLKDLLRPNNLGL